MSDFKIGDTAIRHLIRTYWPDSGGQAAEVLARVPQAALAAAIEQHYSDIAERAEKAEAEVRDRKARAILDLSALQEADERAHAAEQSLGEADAEIERLTTVVRGIRIDLLSLSAALLRASYDEDAERLARALMSGSAHGKALVDRLHAALEPGS